MTITPISQLDPVTTDYLARVDQAAGDGFAGVFQRRTYTPPNPREGWGWLMVGGIACFAVAGYFFRPQALLDVNLAVIPYVQVPALAIGLLLLWLGVRRRMRTNPPRAFRAFLFADGRYLWQVGPEQVEAIPLDQLIDVDGTHQSIGGSYLFSKLILVFQNRRTEDVLIIGRETADQLAQFLSIQATMRKSDQASLWELAQSHPEAAAAIAHKIVTGLEVSYSESIPEPRKVPASGPQPSRVRTAAPVLAALIVAGLGALTVPYLNRYLVDEHLYAATLEMDPEDFAPLDRYLALLPDGQHAAEVRAMWDDGRYAQAERNAKQRNSPVALRDYLANAGNMRHRTEAQGLINGFYDTAIRDLKSRAVGAKPGQIDQPMFDAILALLEALKQSDNPVVTVGFKPITEDAPSDEKAKEFEKLVYDLRLDQEPELKRVERSNKGTAILPRGEVFTPNQLAVRETVILDRLQTAVAKVLNTDLLAIRPAKAGERPVLEVGYQVRPTGGFHLYTATKRTDGRVTSEEIKGLLRSYKIDWTISIRPPGSDKLYDCKLASAPAKSLNYDKEEVDPVWAPYAILMFSAFYDMSNRLIQNFALEAPAAPTTFTFKAATGYRPTKDDPIQRTGRTDPFDWPDRKKEPLKVPRFGLPDR